MFVLIALNSSLRSTIEKLCKLHTELKKKSVTKISVGTWALINQINLNSNA